MPIKKLKQKVKQPLKNLPSSDELADPGEPDLREFYDYSLPELEFLEEYKKDLNTERAGKAVGVTSRTVQNWVAQSKIKDVMARIHDTYVDAILMDSKIAAGEFISVFREMRECFSGGDTKVASALATMSGNFLRATGHYSSDAHNQTPQVQINIDLGNPKPKVKSVGKNVININLEDEG